MVVVHENNNPVVKARAYAVMAKTYLDPETCDVAIEKTDEAKNKILKTAMRILFAVGRIP